MAPPPIPNPNGVLKITREGGLFYAPGLAAPRMMMMSACNADQQTQIAACMKYPPQKKTSAGPDQRSWHLQWFESIDDTAPSWQTWVNEFDADEVIAALWAVATPETK